jgi:hypothetical protein
MFKGMYFMEKHVIPAARPELFYHTRLPAAVSAALNSIKLTGIHPGA